jgi:hypothetical protein
VLTHQRVPRPGSQRSKLALHAAQLARALVRLRLKCVFFDAGQAAHEVAVVGMCATGERSARERGG